MLLEFEFELELLRVLELELELLRVLELEPEDELELLFDDELLSDGAEAADAATTCSACAAAAASSAARRCSISSCTSEDRLLYVA